MKRITKIEPVEREKEKLKVAAYCRVSTRRDAQLESLATQKEHYESFIKKNPEWEYAGIYFDEGITGTKKEVRPGLQQLLKDCEYGKVDYVLSKSISRFARNTVDCLEMVRDLLALGVGIYFEKEDLDTRSMEDEFFLTVLGSLAESESHSIAENQRWSKRNQFKNGTFKQGTPPYGYRLEDGNLVIDEKTGPIARFIFDEALAGKGAHTIAAELNERNIPASKGGRWGGNSVRVILRNERYTGDALYQKTFRDENFHFRINHGELDQFLHKNHHDALISHEEFDKVQQLREQHFQEKGIEKGAMFCQEHYLFSRRVRCGECGSLMRHRIMRERREGPYDAWTCGRHLKSAALCSMKPIPQKNIEIAFTTMMNKLIFSRKKLMEPFAKEIKDIGGNEPEKEIIIVEQGLQEVMKKTQTVAELLAKGLLTQDIAQREQNVLAAKRTVLISRKAMLAAQASENYRGLSEVGTFVRALSKLKISEEFDSEIFDRFVKNVWVYSKNEIGFELTCGLTFKEEVKAE